MLIGFTGLLALTSAEFINAAAEQYRLLERIEYHAEGPDEPMSFEQARESYQSSEWRSLKGPINFGFTQAGIWYRLQLGHDGDKAIKRFLEFEHALLNTIELHHLVDGKTVSSFQSGLLRGQNSKPIEHRYFVFPLDLPAGQTSEIFVRVQTSGSHRIPIVLWDPETFWEDSADKTLLFGALYGTLFMIALINILLHWTLRRRLFLYLGGALGLIATILAFLHGTGFRLILPDHPELQYRVLISGTPLMAILFIHFGGHFMDLRNRDPSAHWLARLLLGGTWLAFVATLFSPIYYGIRIAMIALTVVCVIFLAIGIKLALARQRSAQQFLASWGLLLVGTLGKVLAFAGVLTHMVLAKYGISFGALSASLIFSLVITDQVKREREGRRKASKRRDAYEMDLFNATHYHPLTGLPIRNVFEKKIDHLIAQQCGIMIAVVVIHLRDFGKINHAVGHHTTDRLLQKLIARLERFVSGYDSHIPFSTPSNHSKALAHIEGVTFACAFRVRTRQDVLLLMEELHERIGEPIELEKFRLSVNAVLGCASHPAHGRTAEELMRNAFISISQTDTSLRNVAIFEPESKTSIYDPQRLTLMTDLKTAIETDQLSMAFQPQVVCAAGGTPGFECLLRWQHATRGMVGPDLFIPMAEQGGLMPALTEWVVNRALAFQRKIAASRGPITCSVNISAVNLRDESFLGMLRRALEQWGADPRHLILEVTETAAMLFPEHTLETLKHLHEMGIQISIDDFGTGHSSFAYLRQLPVDEIKVDRSFVMDLEDNPDDQTIVRTIINMCHDLGYRVVAEGVETRSALDYLKILGCDVVQGYYLAHPLDEKQALEWLAAR